MNSLTKVYYWSFVVALGGFLFGLDTAVISGAEKAIQAYWNLSSVAHGFTIASGLIGTVIGAIFAGAPAQKYGRKKVLFVISVLYLLCALGCALTTDWLIFVIARILGGVAVGASSVVGPMYIAEISPARVRGRLVGSFQLNVVFGIMMAYISNYLFIDAGEEAWRWMLGVQAFPSFIFFGLLFTIPESPRWYLLKGDEVSARNVLSRSGETDISKLVADFSSSLTDSQSVSLFNANYRKPVLFVILLATFNQLTGINALLYFAPRIFEMAGIGQEDAFLQSVSVGLTLFIFTFSGVSVIDRFGRRTLLLVGSLGMTFFLALSGWALTGASGGYFPMICLMGFIVFFSFSQGAVIWVFISEIFPNQVRSQGQSLGSTTHWLMAAVISFLFPVIADEVPNGIQFSFYFFSFMMVLHFLFVWKMLPETKGKSLEEIQKAMEGNKLHEITI